MWIPNAKTLYVPILKENSLAFKLYPWQWRQDKHTVMLLSHRIILKIVGFLYLIEQEKC